MLVLQIFSNESYAIHLDHGRGFGKIDRDELDILAPIYQAKIIISRQVKVTFINDVTQSRGMFLFNHIYLR